MLAKAHDTPGTAHTEASDSNGQMLTQLTLLIHRLVNPIMATPMIHEHAICTIIGTSKTLPI